MAILVREHFLRTPNAAWGNTKILSAADADGLGLVAVDEDKYVYSDTDFSTVGKTTEDENWLETRAAARHIQRLDYAAVSLHFLGDLKLHNDKMDFHEKAIVPFMRFIHGALQAQLSDACQVLDVSYHTRDAQVTVKLGQYLYDTLCNSHYKSVNRQNSIVRRLDLLLGTEENDNNGVLCELFPHGQTQSDADLRDELTNITAWLTILRSLISADFTEENQVALSRAAITAVTHMYAHLPEVLEHQAKQLVEVSERSTWTDFMRKKSPAFNRAPNEVLTTIPTKPPRALSAEETAQAEAARKAAAKAATINVLTPADFASEDKKHLLYDEQSAEFKQMWEHATYLTLGIENKNHFQLFCRGKDYYKAGKAKGEALQEKLLAFAKQMNADGGENNLVAYLSGVEYTYNTKNQSLFAHRSRTVTFGTTATETLARRVPTVRP